MEGEVRNISGTAIRNVEAVVELRDANSRFVSSATALIEYQPLLPNQSSPFKVIGRHNPAITQFTVSFKELFGGQISTLYSHE